MIFLPTYRLVEFNVQNNEILDVGRGTCDQSVFAYGEMVRFEDNDRITSLYIYIFEFALKSRSFYFSNQIIPSVYIFFILLK